MATLSLISFCFLTVTGSYTHTTIPRYFALPRYVRVESLFSGSIYFLLIEFERRILWFAGYVFASFEPQKDGAYYCDCAYVLRISRYSGFLSVMLTNTVIFLRALKLSGESRS